MTKKEFFEGFKEIDNQEARDKPREHGRSTLNELHNAYGFNYEKPFLFEDISDLSCTDNSVRKFLEMNGCNIDWGTGIVIFYTENRYKPIKFARFSGYAYHLDKDVYMRGIGKLYTLKDLNKARKEKIAAYILWQSNDDISNIVKKYSDYAERYSSDYHAWYDKSGYDLNYYHRELRRRLQFYKTRMYKIKMSNLVNSEESRSKYAEIKAAVTKFYNDLDSALNNSALNLDKKLLIGDKLAYHYRGVKTSYRLLMEFYEYATGEVSNVDYELQTIPKRLETANAVLPQLGI